MSDVLKDIKRKRFAEADRFARNLPNNVPKFSPASQKDEKLEEDLKLRQIQILAIEFETKASKKLGIGFWELQRLFEAQKKKK